MGDFDIAFQRSLAEQSWSLYSIGMFLIVLRTYARIHRLGLKGLQIDDYVMMLVGCLYTILIVCLNVISQGGGSNLYPPEDFDTFTPEEIKERIHGSKIVIVSEQAMLNVIYSIKACMLSIYTRLTLNLPSRRAIPFLTIYILIGYIATQLAFFLACRPFPGYWAMPPPNPQCTTLQHYALVQGCFNISSDLLMLAIPLPLIYRMSVPWKQKIVLVLIFGMGVFVILAAILTKVFNLTNVWDPSYMLWYTREASVAVYVSNLPMIWPLLRTWFPVLAKLTPGGRISAEPNTRGNAYGGGGYGFGGSSSGRKDGTNNVTLTSITGIKPNFAKRMSDGVSKGMNLSSKSGGGGGVDVGTHKSSISRSQVDELDSADDEMDTIHSKGSREQINRLDDDGDDDIDIDLERHADSRRGRNRGRKPLNWDPLHHHPHHAGGITKSTTVHVHEERTTPLPDATEDAVLTSPRTAVTTSRMGRDNGEKIGQHQRKWDWENDGGNTFLVGAKASQSEYVADGGGDGAVGMALSTTPKRMGSVSRNNSMGGNGIGTPRAVYVRRDTDDEQLSRF